MIIQPLGTLGWLWRWVYWIQDVCESVPWVSIECRAQCKETTDRKPIRAASLALSVSSPPAVLQPSELPPASAGIKSGLISAVLWQKSRIASAVHRLRLRAFEIRVRRIICGHPRGNSVWLSPRHGFFLLTVPIVQKTNREINKYIFLRRGKIPLKVAIKYKLFSFLPSLSTCQCIFRLLS